MDTLHDYVRWIANSMFVDLKETEINDIALSLSQSEKYKEMLKELEGMISDR